MRENFFIALTLLSKKSSEESLNICVNIQQIVMFQSFDKHTIVSTTNGDYTVKEGVEDILNRTKPYGIMKVV